MSDSIVREDHRQDINQYQAMLSQYDEDNISAMYGGWNDKGQNQNTQITQLFGGGTSKEEIEQLMGELREVSKEIQQVDEGSKTDQLDTTGSDNLNESLAIKDQKIVKAVQIAEFIFQEYRKFDENFDQMNERMQAMHQEST